MSDAIEPQNAGNQSYPERRSEAMAWCRARRIAFAQDEEPLPSSVRLIENLVAAADMDLERVEAVVERVRQRHQPKRVISVTGCSAHRLPDPQQAIQCPDCTTREVTVCTNISCHGWPCDDLLALEG